MTVDTHRSTGDPEKWSGVVPSALQQLLAHTADCALLFDRDDRLEDISAAAIAYFGASAAALLGRTLQEVLPQDDVWDAVARARDTQQAQTARISFEGARAIDIQVLPCIDGTLALFRGESEASADTALREVEQIVQVQRETARLLGRTLELQEIFGALHEIVARAMDCDGLIVSSYDPETELIQCQYAWVGGLRLDSSTLPPVRLGPEGSGMQSQVIRSGKPMLFSDVGERVKNASGTFVDVAPDGSAREIKDEAPVTKAAVMAPMQIEGHVTGVVQVMADREGAYSERDAQVLESIVNQLAVAVQNAKLYERVTAELQERLRVEEALRASEARFREMADLLPVLVWSREATGEVFLNQSYFRFVGTDPSAPRQDPWTAVVHPDDLASSKAAFEKALESGQTWEQELRLRRADGQYRWHLSREIPIKGTDGAPLRWIGTSTDIHDRKEAERDLQTLLDALPQIAWICAPDGQITYLNGFWTKLTGLDNRDLSSVPVGIHPEDLAKARRMWAEALEQPKAWSMEYRIRSRDGGYRWHVMHCAPILDGDVLVRWVGGSADVHEQKAAGEELAKLVKERTAELEGFTYSVSHDLRTPLRAIVGSARMLQEDFGDKIPESARALLDRQAAAANKLATLIDDLLRLSRVGRHHLQPEPLDLSSMASEIVDELRQREWPAPLEFEVHAEMHATGDGRLVRLALENLLENACKFSPQGGRVCVGEESGAFFVRDEGIGFDMAYAHKLFQPFERLVRDEEVPGTGIGLANVRRAIERHGGRVWGTSQPGKGATFYFTLG